MANTVTCIRIVCALSLMICPLFSKWFYPLYFVGGASDILDGFIARQRGKETEFGARLDTIADIVFAVIILIKLLHFISIPLWLTIWIVCIAVIKCINITSGLVIHRHFISEHTVMNKICGTLLFVIPLCIGHFPWQPVRILIVLTCVISTCAAIQEGYYIHTGKEIR